MKSLFIILLMFGISNVANSKSKTEATNSEVMAKTENIKKIKVHGMACPMCQSKAEKKFKENESVESVSVDMDKMLITLNLKKDQKLSEKTIKPIVESLGLSFVKIIE